MIFKNINLKRILTHIIFFVALGILISKHFFEFTFSNITISAKWVKMGEQFMLFKKFLFTFLTIPIIHFVTEIFINFKNIKGVVVNYLFIISFGLIFHSIKIVQINSLDKFKSYSYSNIVSLDFLLYGFIIGDIFFILLCISSYFSSYSLCNKK